MAVYRAQGIVLRTIKLGEADRIVTLCTRERGKVRAVAKGIRKTRSKFGGRLEPGSHVAIQCYEGRELDHITQAETADIFRNIREDLDRLRRAIAMLEAVDHLAQPDESSPRLYQMLLGALTSLESYDSPVIVPAFYWKLLAYEGLRPMLDICARCGEDANFVAFDLIEGGLLCRSCRTGVAISPEAIELLRRILGGDLARVLKEPHTAATFEVEHLAEVSLEGHLERRLKTRRILDKA